MDFAHFMTNLMTSSDNDSAENFIAMIGIIQSTVAMLVNENNMNPRCGGVMSAAHDSDDLSLTIAALRNSIAMLRREGGL